MWFAGYSFLCDIFTYKWQPCTLSSLPINHKSNANQNHRNPQTLRYRENTYKDKSIQRNLPNSETSRRWIINLDIGLLPSNPGVQDTLMLRCCGSGSRSTFTLLGGNGSSMTLRRAARVSFPPGEVTTQA